MIEIFKIVGRRCRRDKRGVFHCFCGKCKKLSSEVNHDRYNGNRTRTPETCGYTEEFTDCTPEEVRADYEAHGCRVFSVDVLSD